MTDQVAIAGVGTTPFARYLPGRTMESLALEAARNAILDAGPGVADIDGICTSGSMRPGSFETDAASLQEALGLPATTWTSSWRPCTPSSPVRAPPDRPGGRGPVPTAPGALGEIGRAGLCRD